MIKISVLTPSIRPEGLQVVQECLKKQTFKDFEWLVELGLGLEHDLNASYNRMLRRAKGELIVSYQDFIRIPNDGLELFWQCYEENPEMLFTAPVSKLQEDGKIKDDWRVHRVGEEVDWTHWEIDWAAAPLQILKEIGGFDEELDKYWTFDNVNVGCRADLAGYKFACVDIPAVAIDHDKIMTHPFRANINPAFHNERLDYFRHGNKIKYI